MESQQPIPPKAGVQWGVIGCVGILTLILGGTLLLLAFCINLKPGPKAEVLTYKQLTSAVTEDRLIAPDKGPVRVTLILPADPKDTQLLLQGFLPGKPEQPDGVHPFSVNVPTQELESLRRLLQEHKISVDEIQEPKAVLTQFSLSAKRIGRT